MKRLHKKFEANYPIEFKNFIIDKINSTIQPEPVQTVGSSQTLNPIPPMVLPAGKQAIKPLLLNGKAIIFSRKLPPNEVFYNYNDVVPKLRTELISQAISQTTHNNPNTK